MSGEQFKIYVNGEQRADLEISEDLNMVKISMVSNPVVTAVESNCIWFDRVKSALPWISHHLTL